jgi:simple sugar transport system ATP-binding protein/ribose transport system ATP-binding protein
MVDRLNIQPRRIDQVVAFLSGGNQQKVLFAKWMLGSPRVILLDEPTRGVDIGAKQQIYQVVVDLASSGAAVLLISSELEEVMGLSHRVYLISEGRILSEVDPTQVTIDEVLATLFDANLRREALAEAQ